MPVEISGERRIECASPRERMWTVIADTNRLNELSGLSPVHFEGRRNSPAPFLVRTRLGPFASEYEEYPFEWKAPERFQIFRVMKRGPVRTFRAEWRLEESSSGGTTVFAKVTMAIAPAILAPLARFLLGRGLNDSERAVRHIDKRTARTRSESAIQATAFHRAASRLKEVADERDQPAASALLELVEKGADEDLSRIRPFAVAAELGLDRESLLRTCLVAVEEGLLELSWEVICPSCRTASAQTDQLTEIEAHGECALCDLSFDLDLDFSVEATFHPTAAVRAVRERLYCTGGPASMPHVLAQEILKPGETRSFEAPAEPGRYRLFARGGATCVVEVAPSAPDRVDLALADRLSPDSISVIPGGRIEISSKLSEQTHVKLERMEWASLAASAHRVSLLPGFRERFSAQVLRPNLTLRVQKAALFFSDLSGSTAFYGESGDAAAFAVVQDHFVLLREAIESHDGTVVKTIGDAVMASFPDERRAIAAAIEVQGRFPRFAQERRQGGKLALKIGLFSGPCYAVTSNGVLDYFGQSVNLAARLEGQAGRHEIIITQELAEEADRQGWLEGAEVAERFQADLKGVDGPVDLARIRVATDK